MNGKQGEGTEPLDLKKVNDMLRKIIGLPLTEIWRGGGQVFNFGEQIEYKDKDGEELAGPAFMVKYLNSWCVTCNRRIVFGSGDHGTKRRFYDRKTPPKCPNELERWLRAKAFLERIDNGTVLALDAKVDESLVLKIKLTDKYEIVGIATSAEWEDILWFQDRDLDWSCLVSHSGICSGNYDND